MTKYEQIVQYVKDSPPALGMVGYYLHVAKLFGTTSEYVRYVCKEIKAPNVRSNIQSTRSFNMNNQTESYKSFSVFNCPHNKKEVEKSYIMPESYIEEKKHYKLANKRQKIGVINDVHIPYHDKLRTDLALEYLKAEAVDVIVLNGDIFDFYQISRWSKNPSKAMLSEEIKMGLIMLENLRNYFPDTKIIFKEGNHEERLTAYISGPASGLFGLEVLNLSNLLKLKDFNIDFVHGKQYIEIGDMFIMHGHEVDLYPKGINSAHSMMRKTNASVLFGHVHKTDNWFEPTIDGRTLHCHAVGSLCDLTPDYARTNKWNHGFAIVNVDGKGNTIVENKRFGNNNTIF